jgi:hypothetical protein
MGKTDVHKNEIQDAGLTLFHTTHPKLHLAHVFHIFNSTSHKWIYTPPNATQNPNMYQFQSQQPKKNLCSYTHENKNSNKQSYDSNLCKSTKPETKNQTPHPLYVEPLCQIGLSHPSLLPLKPHTPYSAPAQNYSHATPSAPPRHPSSNPASQSA